MGESDEDDPFLEKRPEAAPAPKRRRGTKRDPPPPTVSRAATSSVLLTRAPIPDADWWRASPYGYPFVVELAATNCHNAIMASSYAGHKQAVGAQILRKSVHFRWILRGMTKDEAIAASMRPPAATAGPPRAAPFAEPATRGGGLPLPADVAPPLTATAGGPRAVAEPATRGGGLLPLPADVAPPLTATAGGPRTVAEPATRGGTAPPAAAAAAAAAEAEERTSLAERAANAAASDADSTLDSPAGSAGASGATETADAGGDEAAGDSDGGADSDSDDGAFRVKTSDMPSSGSSLWPASVDYVIEDAAMMPASMREEAISQALCKANLFTGKVLEAALRKSRSIANRLMQHEAIVHLNEKYGGTRRQVRAPDRADRTHDLASPDGSLVVRCNARADALVFDRRGRVRVVVEHKHRHDSEAFKTKKPEDKEMSQIRMLLACYPEALGVLFVQSTIDEDTREMKFRYDDGEVYGRDRDFEVFKEKLLAFAAECREACAPECREERIRYLAAMPAQADKRRKA